jgi:8-oxo-dGTP diphosphatase
VDFTDYDTRLAAYALIVERDRILLTWYNGSGKDDPGWSLPGGGVEFTETVERAVVREVREETGHDIALHEPIAVHSFTEPTGHRSPRPFKSVRIVFRATIAGGTLGTLEVGGTTDFAEWVPIDRLAGEDGHADIVDVAIDAWRASLPRV